MSSALLRDSLFASGSSLAAWRKSFICEHRAPQMPSSAVPEVSMTGAGEVTASGLSLQLFSDSSHLNKQASRFLSQTGPRCHLCTRTWRTGGINSTILFLKRFQIFIPSTEISPFSLPSGRQSAFPRDIDTLISSRKRERQKKPSWSTSCLPKAKHTWWGGGDFLWLQRKGEEW